MIIAAGILTGRRILVVEDQFVIAMDLERVLRLAGGEVIGPVARLKPAMVLAQNEQFDFAVLDVNLFGEKVFPVADILELRAIPFLLTTGYGESAVPEGRQGWRVMGKPYDPDKVRDQIIATLRN